jgi:glycosyltransferase involved in cell wall biosynthesis
MLASGSGLLVPCGDPVALAQALGRLLDDPLERLNHASEARRSREQLAWPSIAAKFNALLPTSGLY